MASELRVNTINSRTGFGTITVSETGQDLVGITTIENLTTENTLVGAAASFTGNVQIGGVLTYEDVTNIDSVGLITARDGINVIGAGVSIRAGGLNVNSGITTFGGNVNITNTNPKLFFYDSDNNSDYAIVNNGGTFRINDETNSLSRLNITSAGNVEVVGGTLGVKVTPEAWHTDRRVIQLGGSALSGMDPADGQELALTNNGYFDTTDNRWEFIASDDASGIFMSNGGIFFKRSPASGSADAVLSWATSLTINDTGKVGIGTNSLDGKLCVWSGTAGSVSADADADELVLESSGNVGLSLLTAGTGESSIYFGNPGTGGQKDGYIKYYHETHSTTAYRRNLVFATGGGNERLRIDSSGRINIGGAAVSQTRDVNIASNAEANLAIETHNDSTSESSNIRFYKSGNTGASPEVVEANDYIARLQAYGYDGSDYACCAASMEFQVDGTPGGNDMPGKIVFRTTPDGGTSPSTRMYITRDGNVMFDGTPGDGHGIAASYGGYVLGLATSGSEVDTGISINQGNAGATSLIFGCRNTNNGTATQSSLYFMKWYYDGNNAPAATKIEGDNLTFGVSGSNTLTVTGGAGNFRCFMIWIT